MPVVRGFPDRFPVNGTYSRRPLRYRLVSGLFRLVFPILFIGRVTVEGEEHLPEEGRLFLTANHLGALDPLLIGAYYPHVAFAMAKAELFGFAPLSWVLAGCNVFPVDRGTADRRALRTAVDVVRNGGRLLIFVEGTRSRRPGMRRAEPGIGFLLRRSGGATVVPLAMWGTEGARWWKFVLRRMHVHMRYGPPFRPLDDLGADADKQLIADHIASRIAALLPPEYRGAYAGTAPPLAEEGRPA